MIDLEKVNIRWGEQILKIQFGELVLNQDTMLFQNHKNVITPL